MRSLLLCAALLALLAAPARAKKWPTQQKWPLQQPRFQVTGTLLANNKGVGFDGEEFEWTADDKNKVFILVNPDHFALPPQTPGGWALIARVAPGSAEGAQSLKSVAWGYGAIVFAQLDAKGNMVAYLGPAPIRRGSQNWGDLLTISYPRDSCNKWTGCKPRVLEITVRTTPTRPFIKVAFIQPWIAEANPVKLGKNNNVKGSFAEYLEVKVTLLQKPTVELTGQLADTLPPAI